MKIARTHTTLLVCVLIGSVFAALPSASTHAQVALPTVKRFTSLTGAVTDTLGYPIANADVGIARLNKRTRTKSDGTFRFDSIAPGKYTISARSIGYIAPTTEVTVSLNGGNVHIEMIRFAVVLPSMVTSAKQTGLSGIIGDTAYNALADVKISVMGSGKHAVTDSTGAFYIDLKEGHYMLRLEREGFAQQSVGVSVPKDEGRRVAAWMVPQSKSNPVESTALFDLDQRIMRANPVRSKYFSRGDLEEKDILDVAGMARRWATGQINSDCRVALGGRSGTVPISSLLTSDIEFLEVYMSFPGQGNRGVTSVYGVNTKISASTDVVPATTPDCGNLSMIAWLRN